MTRQLTSHKVNGLNEALLVNVLDEPGQGNACHEYQVIRDTHNNGDHYDPVELCNIQWSAQYQTPRKYLTPQSQVTCPYRRILKSILCPMQR